TVPSLGISRPASRPSSVDLPEPEAPTMASVSSAATVKSMSLRIVSSPPASATRFPRRTTSIAGTEEEFSGMQKERWFGKIGQTWHGLMLLLLMVLAGHAYSATKTVLVLGDSLSAEYGIARGNGWVSLLERRIRDQGIKAE